jgi:hypothetical protein
MPPKGQKEYCYFCGKESISREHVPPKCLFPEKKDSPAGKNYRINLITVPSCSIHNLKKSKEDEYLLAVLSINILNNRTGTDQAITKTLRTFSHSDKFAKRFFNKTYPLVIKDTLNATVGESIAIELNQDRLDSILEHIVRGIYFHHFNERLEWELKVINEFSMTIDAVDIKTTLERNNELENLRGLSNEFFLNAKCYGDNREVFFYQIVKDKSTAIIRLTFYEGARVSCLIKFD